MGEIRIEQKPYDKGEVELTVTMKFVISIEHESVLDVQMDLEEVMERHAI